MSDNDDLLPEDINREPPSEGFAEQLGGVFGGTVMIAALFVILGIVAYVIASLTR